jgi:two-component system chemotaxis response regulator CheB
MSGEKKSVVVVDDSPVVRTLLKHIIESCPDFTVTGEAGDGLAAIETVKRLKPAVVTMDVQMPRMSGPEAIKAIMKECPTPILLCSVMAVEGAPVVLEALQAGAFDFVTKPRNVLDSTNDLGIDLIEKLRAALSANRESLATEDLGHALTAHAPQDLPPAGQPRTPPIEAAAPAPAVPAVEAGTFEAVIIGASTGGPRTLLAVLPTLPLGFPATVVVALQDTPPPIIKLLRDQFRKLCKLPCEIVQDGQAAEPGTIWLLSGEAHAMLIRGAEAQPRFKLLDRHAAGEQVPSLNGLMSSAALTYGGHCLGVLLTGLGKDGALGLKKIRQSGGRTIAEDRSTAVLFEKPNAAISIQAVDKVLPSFKITEGIAQFMGLPFPAATK